MSALEFLFSIGPIRKGIWRLWYPYLTRRLRSEDVLFLNYAFQTDPPIDLSLEEGDEEDRACIQLYHQVTSQVDLAGKEVLEVSCGHGGGASWLARCQHPAHLTALDLNPAGISFCRGRHPAGNLTFLTGDAQHLPCPSSSLDAVVNVEASHCYPDFPAFLDEVTRVLRSGGHFLYADFRFHDTIPEWESAIAKAPLELVQTRDISTEVLRGMDLNADRSLALVEEHLPTFLHPLGRDFVGVPGSRIYEALKSGKLSYRSWCLRKP